MNRNTPMKRTGFKQKEYTALRRTELKKGRRLRRVSKKRAKANAEDGGDFRREVMARCSDSCVLCKAAREGVFETDHPHEGLEYQLRNMEVHHVHGKIGSLLHDADKATVLCTWHHLYSEFSPHGGPAAFKELWEELR
jgi:hypothetical protein